MPITLGCEQRWDHLSPPSPSSPSPSPPLLASMSLAATLAACTAASEMAVTKFTAPPSRAKRARSAS
eukprot:CAMPEP_0174733530 /NCGR_PEP_ID=MMETSP1094-20130205/61512_1 /TAXON_ID=156173 /ORGANISM="Chrysochromulina brevifilum, Strain UTEX LB 985" /LENGTH=66 /DNA_ID=CAMNT_0015936211 /DNA_START=397 /DNA_END=594 /DNA_ORIENTATION=+